MGEERIYEFNNCITMARVASKKTVNNDLGLLGTIAGLNKSDVKKVGNFGHFMVVITKDEAIYHSFIGYEVRSKAWVVGTDGKTSVASLFDWLCNLIDMQEESKGKETEPYPETDGSTYQDILDTMVIITEANISHPTTAFTDADEAGRFASRRIDWLMEQTKRLEESASAPPADETEEDLKKNFEHGQKAVVLEQAGDMEDIIKKNE